MVELKLIPLSDGGVLKRGNDQKQFWELYRGDNYIRTLDKYEVAFIDDAIRATVDQLKAI